jgi:hypothetical protein
VKVVSAGEGGHQSRKGIMEEDQFEIRNSEWWPGERSFALIYRISRTLLNYLSSIRKRWMMGNENSEMSHGHGNRLEIWLPTA